MVAHRFNKLAGNKRFYDCIAKLISEPRNPGEETKANTDGFIIDVCSGDEYLEPGEGSYWTGRDWLDPANMPDMKVCRSMLISRSLPWARIANNSNTL